MKKIYALIFVALIASQATLAFAEHFKEETKYIEILECKDC